MIFKETNLHGAFVIELEPRVDERGFFARTFCKDEFSKHGLESEFVQSNWSRSNLKNTLRGMHYQVNPSEEVKLVRCIRGSVRDVIIDIRKNSLTYCQYFTIELSENNNKMLYVPKGFAHGFLTLEDNSELFYQVSAFYSKENERGLRYNDPAFNVNWNCKEKLIVSERDLQHADFIK